MAITYPVLKSTTDSKKDNLIAYNAAVKNALDEVVALTGAADEVSPVVRTNNPTVSTDSVYKNIDHLDTAIGTDAQITPVSRTNNPVVVNSSIHQKFDALDAAIGADMSPVTRTTGQVAVANSVNANIDAIDTVIGFDAQMSGTPLDISKNQTVYQNLDALDAKKTVRTIKKTIGNVGVTADFNFTSANNTTEQCIDLGAILPAKCRLVDIFLFTDAAFTNLGNLTTDVGLTTGTDGLIVAANNTALNAIMAAANAGAFIATPSASAQHVWVNVAPTNNWNSADPVGKMSVYVTFIDVTNL